MQDFRGVEMIRGDRYSPIRLTLRMGQGGASPAWGVLCDLGQGKSESAFVQEGFTRGTSGFAEIGRGRAGVGYTNYLILH
jgi:hypothetical protein